MAKIFLHRANTLKLFGPYFFNLPCKSGRPNDISKDLRLIYGAKIPTSVTPFLSSPGQNLSMCTARRHSNRPSLPPLITPCSRIIDPLLHLCVAAAVEVWPAGELSSYQEARGDTMPTRWVNIIDAPDDTPKSGGGELGGRMLDTSMGQ
jgi:hypothetical protein